MLPSGQSNGVRNFLYLFAFSFIIWLYRKIRVQDRRESNPEPEQVRSFFYFFLGFLHSGEERLTRNNFGVQSTELPTIPESLLGYS